MRFEIGTCQKASDKIDDFFVLSNSTLDFFHLERRYVLVPVQIE